MSFKAKVIEIGFLGAVFFEIRKLAPSILRATASTGAVTAIITDPTLLSHVPAGWVGTITLLAVILKNAVQAIEGFIAYANSNSAAPLSSTPTQDKSISQAHN